MKDPDGAGYPAAFDKDGSHDMTRVARFDSYRGFLFGSLNSDVTSLEEHLGDTTKVIDMLVDQSPDGLEVRRGSSTYTYDGNWKVQAENDGGCWVRPATSMPRAPPPAVGRPPRGPPASRGELAAVRAGADSGA